MTPVGGCYNEAAAYNFASSVARGAEERATLEARALMARHLRLEHGWGWRRIVREVNLSLAEVKRAVGVTLADGGDS